METLDITAQDNGGNWTSGRVLLDAGQVVGWAPGQSMPSMMRKSRSTPSERATSASW